MRRPKESALRVLETFKAQWRAWFPTPLSDDQLREQLVKDVNEIKDHIIVAFKYRKMFRGTTEMPRAPRDRGRRSRHLRIDTL